jgi:hypothetical protein
MSAMDVSVDIRVPTPRLSRIAMPVAQKMLKNIA